MPEQVGLDPEDPPSVEVRVRCQGCAAVRQQVRDERMVAELALLFCAEHVPSLKYTKGICQVLASQFVAVCVYPVGQLGG